MILRTPPPKRARADHTTEEILDSGRHLVIYEESQVSDPSDQQSEHLLCTYQCRQMVKSEFVDALEKAENQVKEYEKQFEAINANLCTSETERRKLQEQLLYIEQKLAAAEGREDMLQEQLLKEVNDNGARLRKQIQANCELEVKVQNEMNLRRNAEASTSSATERVTFLERKVSNLDEKMGREKRRLCDELQQLKNDSEFSASRIHAELDRMECRAVNAEKESVLLKTQLDEAKQRLSECLDQKKDLEKKLSSFTPQGTLTEDGFLVKQLREELRRCESNLREARKMKSSCENAELVKEKLYEEKSRRERAESEIMKLAEFKASAMKMQDELSSWKSIVENIPDVSTPEDILLKFTTLQKELIDKMMEVGEGNSRLKQIEIALDTAELSKRNAEAEASLAKEGEKASKSEARQVELMLSAVTEERDQLRNVVDDLLKTRIATSDRAADANILDVEASISKKEHYIKELESSLHEQRDVIARLNAELKFLMEKLNDDARQIKSLEREGDRLRSEISLLEAKLGHGEFSTANTKVLKMVNTLAADSEAKQIIAVLQFELQKTKEKLQAMEDLKRQSADSGKLVDSYISEKMIQFKEQIATLEKREERYKTVFADRISVFRRACCELFGYKIVMDDHQRSNGIPVTHFTLQSIYAENDDEKLQFEYESGNTNILANDYTSQPEIARQIDVFIRNLNSVPAFTANLTVESFNRRTLS